MPAHVFAYNATSLPNRLTGQRDYWGYVNGQKPDIGRFELLPKTLVKSAYSQEEIWVGSANREPDPNYVQAGVLTQITNPAGGINQFRYEANTIAQQYIVPNPRIVVSADTIGPNLPGHVGGRCNTSVRTFRIDQPVARIRYEAQASGEGADVIHDRGSLTLIDLTIDKVVLSLSSQLDATHHWEAAGELDSVLLTGHTYKLIVQGCGGASVRGIISYESAEVHLAWRNAVVGGLRIRQQRIQAVRNGPATIRRYSYQAPGEVLSSGTLLNHDPPKYSRKQVTRTKGQGSPNCTNGGSVVCPPPSIIDITYTVVSSSSVGELEGLDQIVGYFTVSVTDSSSTGEKAGLTVSTYSHHIDNFISDIPYPPKVIASWKRNQLLSQKHYAQEHNHAKLVAATYHDYLEQGGAKIVGLHSVPDAIFAGTLDLAEPGIMPFAYMNTEQLCGWAHLSRTRQYRYGPDTTSFHLTTTVYKHANPRHQQPTVIETQLTGGQRQQIRYRYAADYDTLQATTGTAAALHELLRMHAVAQLVEQTRIRITGTDTVVTEGSLLLHQLRRPRVVVPAQQLSYRTATPQPLAQFSISAVRNGQLNFDRRYTSDLVVDRYDDYNNVIQQHRPGNTPMAYVWGYDRAQVVAQIENATYDQVLAVLGQSKVNRLLSANPGDDAQVRALLQPLRTQLPQARVTTYTHQPLVGITSQTGPDGRTIFYEYDALGRLLRVRDEQGRILSQQEYKYAKQP